MFWSLIPGSWLINVNQLINNNYSSLPIIATSGLDDDVKVWMPGTELDTAETQQRRDYMTKTIQK